MTRLILLFISWLGLSACSQEPAAADNPTAAVASNTPLQLTIYKTPTCGCCKLWVDHLDNTGFLTATTNQRDLSALKASLGIDPSLRSCHTAVHDQGYFFEGHVPAKWIKQFLASPPAGALGLSVPNMPIGSPGMEVADRFEPYEILLVNSDGSSAVYAKVTSYEEQF